MRPCAHTPRAPAPPALKGRYALFNNNQKKGGLQKLKIAPSCAPCISARSVAPRWLPSRFAIWFR